jgi:transposase
MSSVPIPDAQHALEPKEVAGEIQEKLTQALRGGNDIETAAHFAGISVSQIYRWLEVGKFEAEKVAAGQKPDPATAQMIEFWETLRKARAEAIVRNVAYVQTAAKQGSWQAAAWWLERAVPETYSRTKASAKPDSENQRAISGD